MFFTRGPATDTAVSLKCCAPKLRRHNPRLSNYKFYASAQRAATAHSPTFDGLFELTREVLPKLNSTDRG